MRRQSGAAVPVSFSVFFVANSKKIRRDLSISPFRRLALLG
jgi:hypothetical protein